MSNISGIVKSGISVAAFAMGYAAAMHPVTSVALAAFPWAAHRLSQCCLRRKVKLTLDDEFYREYAKKQEADHKSQGAIRGAAVGLDEKHNESNLDDEMRMALAASMDPSESVWICPCDGTIIPQALLFEKSNGQKCNVASYMLSLLSGEQLPTEQGVRDILNLAVDQNDLESMANFLGITRDDYLSIWAIAALSDGDKREARFALFKGMVTNPIAIQYYREYHSDIWNRA